MPRILPLAILGLGLMPAAVLADLSFCNQTADKVSVAIAHGGGADWVSEGWWGIEPGACTSVIAQPLERAAYFYRVKSAGRDWQHDARVFCTSEEVFEITGDADCAARGYLAEAFDAVDREAGASSVTVTLTAGPETAAPKEPAVTEAAPTTEAFSAGGVFRGCPEVNGARACEVLGEGTRFVASEAGPTELDLIDALDDIAIGTNVQITGRMLGRTGDRAEIELQGFIAGAIEPPVDNGPGTFGEPFALIARFEGCEATGETILCSFRTESLRYVIRSGGPTADKVIEAMLELVPGLRLHISGDILVLTETSVEVMLREIATAPEPTPETPTLAGLMEHLQGQWASDLDDGYAWVIDGDALEVLRDGETSGRYFFELHTSCAGADGLGPVILAYPDAATGGRPVCFLVTATEARRLAVTDVVQDVTYSFTDPD